VAKKSKRKRGDDDGDVIPERPQILGIIFSPIGVVLGLVLVIYSLANMSSIGAFKPLILGLVLLVGSLGCLGYFAYQLIFNPRLVLDDDSLMMVRGPSGIVGNIPFDNIAAVEIRRRIVRDQHGNERSYYNVLQVMTMKRKDPDTYWPRRAAEGGFEIKDGYRLSLARIRRMILDRVEPLIEHKRRQRGL